MQRQQGSRRARWLPLLVAATGIAGAAVADPAQDYMLHCMGCHGARAEGVAGKVPPLAHALARFMRSATGRSYVLRVPGAANSTLSDQRLAGVLNWVAQRFDADELSSATAPFTTEEVAAQRHTPLAAVLATRQQVLQELAASGPAPAAHY
jgi:mono/diheme cytochrome c family protein